MLCLTDRIIVYDYYRPLAIRCLGDSFDTDPLYRDNFETMATDIMLIFKSAITLNDCRKMTLPELTRWHERAKEIQKKDNEKWRG